MGTTAKINKMALITSAVKANIPVLLEGHTGTGKTWQVMELATKHKKTLHVINVSGELTVDSILGRNTLIDGTVHWRDGVLTTAMRKGDWVLFDELNTALPEVLTVINGVLDDSGAVTLPKDDNERVERHVDFRFFGTQNPASGEYAGTARINGALLNRMVVIEFGYMEPEREVEVLKSHSKLADNTLLSLVEMASFTRDPSRFDGEPVSTRDLVKIVRLRDNGNLTIHDSVSFILAGKYSRDEYNRLYDRFSSMVSEFNRLGGYTDEYLIDVLRKKSDDLHKQEVELAKAKRDLRATVRAEMLQELLDRSDTDTPEGF